MDPDEMQKVLAELNQSYEESARIFLKSPDETKPYQFCLYLQMLRNIEAKAIITQNNTILEYAIQERLKIKKLSELFQNAISEGRPANALFVAEKYLTAFPNFVREYWQFLFRP